MIKHIHYKEDNYSLIKYQCDCCFQEINFNETLINEDDFDWCIDCLKEKRKYD